MEGWPTAGVVFPGAGAKSRPCDSRDGWRGEVVALRQQGRKNKKEREMIRLLLFALLFAMPAAADDVFMNNTTSESNMCVIDVTGQTASSPSAVAHANWSPITYNCAAGTYLPAGNTWSKDDQYDNGCETCPANWYCTGGQYTYDADYHQGINDCKIGYTSSAGASSCTQEMYSINYILNGGSILPSDYTQLEYIESTGEQYIDTGYIVQMGDTVNARFEITNADTNWRAIFGGASNGTNGMFYVSVGGGNNACYFANIHCGTWQINTPYKISVFVNNINDANSWLVAGSRQTLFPITLENVMLKIFARNSYESRFIGKFYFLDVVRNNLTIHQFIPARRNSDSVLGMYDTVTNTFFTNDGTGAFVAGPVDTMSESYKYGTGATISARPTRSHSSFAGWCTDAGLTNCAATQTIGTTATGDKTFYAKYLCDTGYSTNVSNTSCNANTITVNWDNGAGGTTQNTCTYGGDLTTPTTAPTKRGHVFTGWTFNLN